MFSSKFPTELLKQIAIHEELLNTIDGTEARQHLELKYSPRYVDRVVSEIEHIAECATRVRAAAEAAKADGM